MLWCVLSFQMRAQVSFTLASSPAVGPEPQFVVAADLIGNGKLDLATPNQDNNTLSLLTNNGSGAFSLASSRRPRTLTPSRSSRAMSTGMAVLI
jgi:hypothetical protein